MNNVTPESLAKVSDALAKAINAVTDNSPALALSAFEAMKHSVVIDGWTSLVICATTTIGFGAFIPGAIRFLKREQHQESTRGYGDRSGDVGPAFGLVAVLFTATIFSFFGAGYAARKILAPEYIVITKIMETVK